MSAKITAKPLHWESSIDATRVANSGPRLADLRIDGDDCYWLESQASENGRMALMRSDGDKTQTLVPAPFSVCSKVHEYGGAAFCINETHIYFVNAKDQNIYRVTKSGEGLEAFFEHNNSRFGDLVWDTARAQLLCVCEEHDDHLAEAKNSIVAISATGQMSSIAAGKDFYAYPRVNKTGDRICWVSWSHPNMPWDATTLEVFGIDNQNQLKPELTLGSDTAQSIVQPVWADDGSLYFVSDIDNWWTIYRLPEGGSASDSYQVYRKEAEFATPLWQLGMQHYAVTSSGDLIAASTQNGFWEIERIRQNEKDIQILVTGLAWVDRVSVSDDTLAFIDSGSDYFPRIRTLNLESKESRTMNDADSIEVSEISCAQSIRFNTLDNLNAHAFFYEPKNSKFESDSKPPLIVLSHGGPTAQTSAALNYKIQFWTNRGFAVVDVNYRGSTGFGRKFRQALYKKWGLADVDDLVTAAEYLRSMNKVDAKKQVVKGSSAGGFSVLAALTFTDEFAAGVSLYGIGDLELLVKDTHKFEAHYLNQLVGPYPKCRDLYLQRSPIHYTDKLSCPLLLFQGLQDKVVPPEQAQLMARNVERKGIPVKLVEYPDESHGFRSPATIKHMLETELEFYKKHLL